MNPHPETLDEAIGLANDTSFGPGGLVFSADLIKALQVAQRMDTGSVGISFFASNHNAPCRRPAGLRARCRVPRRGAVGICELQVDPSQDQPD